MAPAAQIIVSALLFTFGIITPESLFTSPNTPVSASILSATALAFGTLILSSFVISRILSWLIHR